MEQTTFLPKEDADDLMREALAHFKPLAVVGLTSGGKDSTVVCHRMRGYLTDGLAFIDTGTAVPGVREFVQGFAQWMDHPLRILDSGDAYQEMVLHMGFPGPGQHHRAYQRLKERQLEVLRRELKHGKRGGKVLFVTGIRRAESWRRRSRFPITNVGSMGFVNPLIDWTDSETRAYQAQHKIPESDVAALLHKSGECNCGCYARDDEREMLQALWPVWFDDLIGDLERQTGETWGARSSEKPSEAGALCSDCQPALFFDA